MTAKNPQNSTIQGGFARRGWFAVSVEASLNSAVDRLPTQYADGCRVLVNAGGKRLRPELVGACAQAGAAGWSGAVSAAVAVELLHSASLVHDDLLDNAATRRGVPAIHQNLGSSSALIAGDAMIALSWQYIAESGAQNAGDLGAALSAMCEGQALEESLTYNLDADFEDVLRVAQLKTGALIESACRIGARLGGCTQHQVDALGMFGRHLGIELQLLDDVLDLVSDAETMGKPTNADFRSGLLTMPTVFAVAASQPRERNRLRRLFAAPISEAEAAEARELIIKSGAVSRTVELARDHAGRAADCAVAAGAETLGQRASDYLSSQLRKVTDNRAGQIDSPDAARHSQLDWEIERAG